MSAAHSPDHGDIFKVWCHTPFFDFLEQVYRSRSTAGLTSSPKPWNEVASLLIYAVIAAGTGILFAYLSDEGFVLLRKPAKITWSLALLILAWTGATGLPREFKFGVLCVIVGFTVPATIFAGSLYVYSRDAASPGPVSVTGDDKEASTSSQTKVQKPVEVDRARVPEVGEIRL